MTTNGANGIRNHSGAGEFFSIALRSGSFALLKEVIDRRVPYVYIDSFWPNSKIEWWKADVPLDISGATTRIAVRNLSYDLLVTIGEFENISQSIAKNADHHGLSICQLHKALPETLYFEKKQFDEIVRNLCQNGLHLYFYMAHAGERAVIAAPQRQTLEAIIQNPLIQAQLVIE